MYWSGDHLLYYNGDSDAMSFDEKALSMVRTAHKCLPLILAATIMIAGVYNLWQYITFEESMASFGEICGAVIMIAMGLLILFDPKKSILRSIGFYAMALGLSRVMNSLSSIASESDMMFIIGLVMFGMGVNLMYSGFCYLKDTSRGRFGMTMASALLALLMIILIVMMSVSEETSAYDMSVIISCFISLIQYSIVLLLMDMEVFRFGSFNEKALRKMDDIRRTYAPAPDMAITRDGGIVLKHMFDDRSSWTPVEDGGPVECEKKLCMEEDRAKSVMILQKWKDSDKIHATMVVDDNGTILQANRFSISDVVADNDDDSGFKNLRLYADGRMVANLAIAETEVAA